RPWCTPATGAGPSRAVGCRRATACTTISTPAGSGGSSTAGRRCRSAPASSPPVPSSGCAGDPVDSDFTNSRPDSANSRPDSANSRPSEDVPAIAVVIVTYNSADVLGDCLRSLAGSRGIDLSAVVVADNASKDDSVAIAEAATDLPIQTVQVGR